MKKLIFFIFILSCTGNKERFKGNFDRRGNTEFNHDIDSKNGFTEESLADEAEKAIENDNLSKLKELFSKGLRINRKYKGKSLLFRAIEGDKKVCTKYLLSQGAIISEEFDKSSLRDKEIGWGEVTISSWQRSPSLDELSKGISIRELKERQKQFIEDIFIKLNHRHCKDEEKYILNRILAGANINELVEEIIDYRYSSLHALASRGTKLILEEFLKRYECDVNEVDNEGRTALSHAMEGNIIFAKALLENGLDPNIHKSNNLSYAPTVYAIHNWLSHEDVEFLELLIQKTFREDILKESLKVLQSDKFKTNLKNTITISMKRIERIEDQLKITSNEDLLKLKKELNENTTKIRKMIILKENLEKNCYKNSITKNILFTETTF